jgi:3-methyl-2-oxobutanoate hydroxymethyltransferase
MNAPEMSRVTIPSLRARKGTGEKIVALTAYDHAVASIVDAAGVDILLVGDSLGMVLLGYENTLAVTMDDMLHHIKPVARAARRALVVGDMPFLSYHLSEAQAVANAGRFIQEGGAEAVKIEGASPRRIRLIKTLVEADIPVLGHVGLTPQSVGRFGGFKVQGTTPETGRRLVREAQAVERAGAFAVIVECVPAEVAGLITAGISIPTIGIGAGPRCDGQILVFHDLVGCHGGYLPRFVKPYADLHVVITDAVGRYREDVRTGVFPDDEHSYHLKPASRKPNRSGGRKSPRKLGSPSR